MFPVSFGGPPPLPANTSYASEASRASYPATAAAQAGAGSANYPASAVAHASWQVPAGLPGNSDHNEEISLSGSSIKNMDEGSLEQLRPVLLLRQLHGVTWAMATWSGPFLGDSPCCWADLDDASSPKQYFSKARPALGGRPCLPTSKLLYWVTIVMRAGARDSR